MTSYRATDETTDTLPGEYVFPGTPEYIEDTDTMNGEDDEKTYDRSDRAATHYTAPAEWSDEDFDRQEAIPVFTVDNPHRVSRTRRDWSAERISLVAGSVVRVAPESYDRVKVILRVGRHIIDGGGVEYVGGGGTVYYGPDASVNTHTSPALTDELELEIDGEIWVLANTDTVLDVISIYNITVFSDE